MSPIRSPPLIRRRKSWARRCERYCCSCITLFPLVFVYGLTTWAVWVQVTIGLLPAQQTWTGSISASAAVILYALLNWCYTVAVFTDPGSSLSISNDYMALPSSESRDRLSLTVKSTGEIRYCKKCQTQKPDRAHHCSTCGRCVLKMDHHCPWLAACVGFRNYKPFLLFLIYTCLFCWLSFAASATWVWYEILSGTEFEERLMPVNYILLAVLGGIIGLVLTGFTAWHVYLASRGQTTIESLESTRYVSPLQDSLQRGKVRPDGTSKFSDQLREIHANTIPGVTRAEEGVERRSPAHESLRRSYRDVEVDRERRRWANYLDEQDSEKLPNAFDLGWSQNLIQVFGESKIYRWLPVCNSVGNGWSWETSPGWANARAQLVEEREARAHQQATPRSPISNDPEYTSRASDRGSFREARIDDVALQELSSDRSPSHRDPRRPSSADEMDFQSYQDQPTSNWNDIPNGFLNSTTGTHTARGTRSRSPKPRQLASNS